MEFRPLLFDDWVVGVVLVGCKLPVVCRHWEWWFISGLFCRFWCCWFGHGVVDLGASWPASQFPPFWLLVCFCCRVVGCLVVVVLGGVRIGIGGLGFYHCCHCLAVGNHFLG